MAAQLPSQFRPPKSFSFPKREFGSKGENRSCERAFILHHEAYYITLKSYLRSTLKQSRLNHTMVLNIYKEELDILDIVAVANEFVSKNEHHNQFFGRFV